MNRSHVSSNTTGEFKKAYPDAKLVAVEEAVEKKKGEGLDFAGCEWRVCIFCDSVLNLGIQSGATSSKTPSLASRTR